VEHCGSHSLSELPLSGPNRISCRHAYTRGRPDHRLGSRHPLGRRAGKFLFLRHAPRGVTHRGERDIFGHQYGGEAPKNYVGVEVTAWERIGNYAIRFDFSDGHRTGLYSYDLLRQLGAAGP
jgi:hypothetical protein